jgi:Big-like domain-containing protein/Calx-beta domain-containing protein/FIMAH domain-containing protein
MPKSGYLMTAVAVVALSWSTTIVRGDQRPHPSKAHNKVATDDGSGDDDRMSGMGHLAHLAATGRLDKALKKARRKSLQGEKVEVFLDTELGGDDGDAEDGPAGGQAETSIAVDASGQHIVLGYNDTRGFAENPTSLSGVMYSDDGGATFVDGGRLPSPGTDLIGTTRFPQVFGDPEIKYLGGSTFVYFSIMVKKFSANGTAQTMCVHRSTDNGHTWQGPFEIPAATNPHGLVTGAAVNARDSADKEFAAIDPDSGRAMLSWSNFTATTFAAGGVEISTTFSDDLATATPPTWSARRIIAATAADGQASQPFFAGNGSSNAYVVWRRFAATTSAADFFGNGQNVGFARSTDNGATFSAPINLTDNFFTSDEILGNDRRNTSPSIAVDNSPGPNHGTIYITYANNSQDDGSDIMVQRSVDGGVTFSAPVAVDSRPGRDRAQWFPWATVDTATGRAYVFYYDQGIAAAGDLTETTVQFSDDGGLSWSKPTPLSDRPFHAAYGNDTGQPNIGDYNQAVAQNGELLAIWAGTVPVGFTDGQPSTSMTTPDVVFKRLAASSTTISLSLGTPAVSEPGNGFIDPGDLVSFTLPLTNYVTNPPAAAAVSGISATLSTSTPGVSVVQATQSYGSLAPGATAGNASPFTVQFDQSFVPGRHVEFVLTASSAQGSVVLPFTQSTGAPIATPIFTENFDGVAAGALPAGWSTSHGGGSNVVPWTTNATFMGSNAAFHINANDAANPTRFERLFSPLITVPADAEYVTMDFDVAYDTEDDLYDWAGHQFNVLAYDGFLLRITDQTPGSTLRSVQIESFAEEFTTGGTPFYPKKMPRNSSTAYLQDLSAWAGFSNGVKHVHLKLPGMAGTTVQLRWEFTQDSGGTCADLRPGHTCGVGFDNIVMNSVRSSSVVSTATTVSSSQNPSDSGQPVTFTAAVTAGSAVAAGTVTFRDGATVLASAVAVDAGGHAAFTTAALSSGTHTITAEYSGTTHFAPSSGSVLQQVDALPSISITDVSVPEGQSGTSNAVFTVSLSGATHTATVQVSYATADGTAASPADYAAGSGSLSFPPGTTSRTVSVAVNGDTVIEPNETFTVNLSAASNASIGDGQGVGTIVNDDTVATAMAALLAQVGAINPPDVRGNLVERLLQAQRNIDRGRADKAIDDLQKFIDEVADEATPKRHRLDPATAAVWIAEARSIIAALMTT